MKPIRAPLAVRWAAAAALLALPAALPGWAQPAVEVADLNVQTPFTVAAPVTSDVVPLSGGRLFFLEGAFLSTPAVTDGRRTERLADLFPDPAANRFQAVGRLGDLALFLAAPYDGYPRLFRSDGTRAGTFSLGVEPADPSLPPALAGGRLFFEACPPGFACALWQSDGSREGTRPVPGAPGFTGPSRPQITAVGRRAFFLAGDGNPALDLWVSDGTAAGTARARALGAAAAPRLLTGAASRLYFLATVADGSEQLWTSDGTPTGTRPLTTFAHGALIATRWIATAGDRAYLIVDDVVAGGAGAEIWVSDGTPAGTRRATDLGYFAPFDAVTSPDRLQDLGGRLIFPASDGLHGLEPWATAGTPGSTTLLAPVHLDPASSLVRVGSRVVFSAVGESGDEIWATDGTPAGTRRLAVACPGSCDASRLAIVALLGAAFFVGQDRPHGVELWATDGTPAGTHPFTDGIPDDSERLLLSHLAASGGRLFFTLGEIGSGDPAGTLWTSDGQPGGTRPVPPDATLSGAGAEPRELTALGDRLFFTACDGTARQLFESDGTTAGTVARTALSPSPTGCNEDDRARGLTVIPGSGGGGGTLFYLLPDASGATSLWRLTVGSDPQRVATFEYPASLSSPVPLGSEVFFEVFSSSGTNPVWRSDGTTAGTHPDSNLASLTRIYGLAAAPGALYVAGLSPDESHFEIWRSDGQIGGAGTAKLLDLPPTAFSSASELFPLVTPASASLFFTPYDETTARLWRTDGTAAGTIAVHDFAFRIGGPPAEPTLFGDRLYFFADTPNGRGLWRSDGTPAGTVPLFEVPPGGYSEFGRVLAGLTPFLGRLFFAADDGIHGRELWSSDGTSEGTALFADLNPGPDASEVDHLRVAGGRLFFSAFDPLHGHELWQSDGTAPGTRMAADVAPESDSSNPDQLEAVAGQLYFTADDGLSGRELWRLPLTGPAGCQPGDTRLCLAGNRFQVEIAWKDFQGHTGVGHAVGLTADTGYFWFFAPSNVETVVKVLDARSLSQAFWVFYGALSSVEYTITVTDTATGLTRRYFNPSGQLASVGDTNGFGPLGAFDSKLAEAPAPGLPLVSARTDARASIVPCAPAPGRLCLQGNRFAVTAAWKDFQGHSGTGTAVPLTADTGYFWFFNASNVEVVAKVLDGRGLNGKFWLFYGALSNVEYTLTVTDTQTGAVKIYKNPSGQFGSVGDTGAF